MQEQAVFENEVQFPNGKPKQARVQKSPGFRDNASPQCLTCKITDPDGNVWGVMALDEKFFSTGSVGFYGNGKLINPGNPAAKYQAGFNLTLVGSKSE